MMWAPDGKRDYVELKNPFYTIIVPCYNEAEVIQHFWNRLNKTLLNLAEARNGIEVIFIDDGSEDNTYEILSNLENSNEFLQIKIFKFSRNFGHQAALICGYKESKGECVITIDADLQDPPEIILDLIKEFHKGADVISAKRKVRSGEKWIKIATADLFYKAIGKVSTTKLSNNVGDFKCVSRRALNAFLSLNEREQYLRGMFAWIGFNQTFVQYSRDPRFAGRTKYSLSKMLQLANNGLINFSGNAMRLPFYMSFLIALIAIAWIIILIVTKILNPLSSNPGFVSLMILLLFSISTQLFILGLLGEYIYKNLTYVQNRPTYIIMENKNCPE